MKAVAETLGVSRSMSLSRRSRSSTAKSPGCLAIPASAHRQPNESRRLPAGEVNRGFQLTRIARQRENIIQAIKDGVPAAEVKDDLARISARHEELEALLSGEKEEPVLLHPGMAAHYRSQVANLVQVLGAEENRAEAANILRSLIDRIALTPNAEGKLDIDLYGDLAGILSLAANAKGPLDESGPLQDKMVAGKRNRLVLAPEKQNGRPDERTADLIQQVKMVAGAGFEPATFRL